MNYFDMENYVLILLYVPSGVRTIAHEEDCCLVTVRVYVRVRVRIGGYIFLGGEQFSFHVFSIMLCSEALIENVNVKMFKYVQENI